MISLQYAPENVSDQYGLQHFVERSGIPFDRPAYDKTGSVLEYGSGNPGNFSITLKKNTIESRICGNVEFRDCKVPVFALPENTGTGKEVIAVFDNGKDRFPCITCHDQGISVGIDIFAHTGCILSGHLDRIWASLDEPGRSRIASTPVIDFLEDILIAVIFEGCREMDLPLIQNALWPEGKHFAVCLTHDVDEIKKTYQWITRPVRSLLKRDMIALKGQARSLMHRMKGKEPYWTFTDIGEIERRFHATSTFFFLCESGKPCIHNPGTWNFLGRNRSFTNSGIRKAIALVGEQGNEVGIHGSFYSYIKDGLIEDETLQLEGILHRRVLGIRQHHLNYSHPDSFHFQQSAGLTYDSSIGYKDRIGFRWGTSFPFFPLCENKPVRVLEIPLTIMDICLLDLPDPGKEAIVIADQVKRHQGVLTLLWHPPIFNEDEFPGGKKMYHDIIKWSVERGAWVTDACKISSWFRSRNASSLSFRQESSSYRISLNNPEEDSYFTVTVPRHISVRFSPGDAVELGRTENLVFKGTDSTHFRISGKCRERNREIIAILS